MKLEQVRRTYTRWAPLYDATHAWTLPGRRAARQALRVYPGQRVLDLACGTGLNLPHLRRLVGEQGSVAGINLTPAMLEIARRRIAAAGWGNVAVAEADAARLPFPDESFERALCTFALNIIPEYVRAIEEVWRVLVPGGRFVALEARTALHPLPHWLKPLPRVCAVNVSHRALQEIRRAFGGGEILHTWLGLITLTAVEKRNPKGC